MPLLFANRDERCSSIPRPCTGLVIDKQWTEREISLCGDMAFQYHKRLLIMKEFAPFVNKNFPLKSRGLKFEKGRTM